MRLTRVLEVPATLDSDAFDALVAGADAASSDRLLVDARHVRFADPYGMIGLLAIGEQFGREGEAAPILQLPDSPEVVSYLSRMGFMSAAEKVFELHNLPRGKLIPGPTVLLPITVIDTHDAVHRVIDAINTEKIRQLITQQLGYSGAEAAKFSIMMSEVSQNIMEHADSPGWVAVQTYDWSRRKIGRKVAVIAVMDLGIGFRQSLARDYAVSFGDRWGDATALEQAFIHNKSRFREPGRGQGLQRIRKQVGVWGGKVAIRSGTARIADVPDWDDGVPMETGLAEFPGAQILIVLPAKNAAPASPSPAAPGRAFRARPG